MNEPLASLAATMRQAFDVGFAEPHRGAASTADNFLTVRLGGDPYAIRLVEVGGLFADRKMTTLASRIPALSGLTSIRGAILPVYDLTLLMGYSKAGLSRWLVVAAAAPVAFACEGFDGHLRLPRNAAAPIAERERARAHVHEVARTHDHVLPVVHVPSVLEAIKQRLPGGGHKER